MLYYSQQERRTMNMTTPQLKYDKENAVKITMKLNKRTDRDILEKLEETGNKQGYIKSLIRKDIYETNQLRKELINEYSETTFNAMIEVLHEVGFYEDETMSVERIINNQITNEYLSVNEGNSGISYVWYYDGSDNVIYNLDTNEMLNEANQEEELKELLSSEFNIDD